MFIRVQHPRQHEALRSFGDARSELPPDLACHDVADDIPFVTDQPCGSRVVRVRISSASSPTRTKPVATPVPAVALQPPEL